MADPTDDTMILSGKVMEAGKGGDSNEVFIQCGDEPGFQLVRIVGISDTLTKWLAAHLYETVTVEFTRE